MDRKFVLATLAAFAASFVLGFVFHGVLLAGDYTALPGVYRGPEFKPALFSLLLLAQLVTAAAMTALYPYGVEDKPFVGQGFRFGLLAAGIGVIPCYMIGYVVTNITGALAVKQIILETVRVVAMVLVIAWFYQHGTQREVAPRNL